jgi:hypothetical protein
MSAAEANGQCTAEQLQTMSPAEIVKAQQDGRLDSLLGRRTTGAGDGTA